MNPTVASLILSLESCISVLAGWVLLDQKLSIKELLGCVIMFAAIILAQLPEKKKIINKTGSRFGILPSGCLSTCFLVCCFFLLNEVIIMCLDLLKALLADVVLHLAGILHCDLCRNPKSLQHPGKNNVTLINLIGDLCPFSRSVTVP